MKTNTYRIKFILAIVTLLLGSKAFAMDIFVEIDKDLRVGDIVVAKVMMNTGEQEINAVEGEIIIEGNFEPVTITTAGSIFDLWPNKPSLEKKKIYFVGGTTAGVFGNRLRLFNIALKPLDKSNLNFKISSSKAFLNDGSATKISIAPSLNTFTVKPKGEVSVNNLSEEINADRKSPKSFTIELGQGLPGQENKYFLSFFTKDDETGINHYEVTEGNLPMVRSGNTYILQNQNLGETIEIKAIDNAGNIQTETIHPKKPLAKIIFWIIIIFIVLLKCIFIYRKNKK